MSNTGSRLGEIPLAWASCLLAQKLSESPGRLFLRTGQGEPLLVSPRRDWVAWARFTDLAVVSPVTAMFSDQITHAKYFHTSKRQIQPCNQQSTINSSKGGLETRTLTSRTWKRLTVGFLGTNKNHSSS